MSVAMVTQNSAARSTWASGATAATTPTSDATSCPAATQSGSSSSNTAAPSGVTIPFQQLANDLQAMLVQVQQTETGTTANGGTSTTANGTTGTSDATASGTDASSARPHHHHHHHSDTQATGPGKLQADAARLLQRSQRRHKPERERGFAHSARWLGGSAGLGGQRWLGQFSLRHRGLYERRGAIRIPAGRRQRS